MKRKLSESKKGQRAWNKGLTKNDPRVAKYVNKRWGTNYSESEGN